MRDAASQRSSAAARLTPRYQTTNGFKDRAPSSDVSLRPCSKKDGGGRAPRGAKEKGRPGRGARRVGRTVSLPGDPGGCQNHETGSVPKKPKSQNWQAGRLAAPGTYPEIMPVGQKAPPPSGPRPKGGGSPGARGSAKGLEASSAGA